MGIDKLNLEGSWLDLAKLISREQQKMSRGGIELAGAEKVRDVFVKRAPRQNF